MGLDSILDNRYTPVMVFLIATLILAAWMER